LSKRGEDKKKLDETGKNTGRIRRSEGFIGTDGEGAIRNINKAGSRELRNESNFTTLGRESGGRRGWRRKKPNGDGQHKHGVLLVSKGTLRGKVLTSAKQRS